MMVMGVASITPAFPLIQKKLGIHPAQVGYLITFFTIPGMILTPLAGFLADRYGRKKILIPSLLLFGVAGVSCAFTKNFSVLLFFRFLQGIGSSSLGAMNITIISDIFEGRERGRAMGYNASVLSIGTASYPGLGGFLSDIGWYYPFFLPILAIPIALAVLTLPEKKFAHSGESIVHYFKNIFKEIKKRNIIVLFLSSTGIFIILYGVLLSYFPFYMDHHYSSRSSEIGLFMSSMSIITAIMASRLGYLHSVFSKKNLIIAGGILYSIAAFGIIETKSKWFVLLPIIVVGAAQGIVLPSIQTYIADLSPKENRALFMAFNVVFLRLGQTMGPLMMGWAFLGLQLEGVFWIGAFLGIAISLIVFLFLDDDKKNKSLQDGSVS